jgi:hypothetical protein
MLGQKSGLDLNISTNKECNAMLKINIICYLIVGVRSPQIHRMKLPVTDL